MIVACKLPHGLTIKHNGQTIDINGANAGADPLAPVANGSLADSAILSAGFGLTVLNDAQGAAFTDWANKAQFNEGAESKGVLDEPFAPLRNGALEIYKSMADAKKETASITTDVSTGFEGLDGDAEIKEAAAAANPNLVDTSGANKAQ